MFAKKIKRPTPEERNIPVRGRFLYKENFYSICSMHYVKSDNCKLCKTGVWKNVFLGKITHLVYRFTPSIWRYFANLKIWRKKGARNIFESMGIKNIDDK